MKTDDTPITLKEKINRHHKLQSRVYISNGTYYVAVKFVDSLIGEKNRRIIFQFLFEVDSSTKMSIQQKFGFAEWVGLHFDHVPETGFVMRVPSDSFLGECAMLMRFLKLEFPKRGEQLCLFNEKSS